MTTPATIPPEHLPHWVAFTAHAYASINSEPDEGRDDEENCALAANIGDLLVAELVERLPTPTVNDSLTVPVSPWILCSERYPDEGQEVFARQNSIVIAAVYRCPITMGTMQHWFEQSYASRTVVWNNIQDWAWMPIPPPPNAPQPSAAVATGPAKSDGEALHNAVAVQLNNAGIRMPIVWALLCDEYKTAFERAAAAVRANV